MAVMQVLLTHALVCLFGIGSWIAINGLWVELPILVIRLPEGWELGSYLSVIIQLANIGPLVFMIGNYFFPKMVKEKSAAYIVIFIGIVSCLLLVFFWDQTSWVAGALHSTALLVLQFFLAMVDCTSSVVFLPYMSVFKEKYMTTYFMGEGLSGLLPSVIALIQGSGAVKCVNTTTMVNVTNGTDVIGMTNKTSIRTKFLDPNFPVEDFFYFLFAMMLVCGAAFFLLNHLKICKDEYAPTTQSSSSDSLLPSSREIKSEALLQKLDIAGGGAVGKYSTTQPGQDKANINVNETQPAKSQEAVHSMSKTKKFYLLGLILIICALSNGILPSIQSYSCLPYGTSTYHYAVTLASIANPSACFIAFFIPTSTVSIITGITAIGLGIAGYIISMACMSPTPILIDNFAGSALVVSAWILATLLLTYAKVNIALIFRKHGRKALLWCGAVTQLGSAIGAICMFIIVSVLKVFVTAPYC